jgi:hypothetical protein
MRKDILSTPDLRMFDSMTSGGPDDHQKHADAGRRSGDRWSPLRPHRNMLKNAVMSFYQAGIKGYVENLQTSCELYPNIEDFQGSLDEYVAIRFQEKSWTALPFTTRRR